MSVKEIELHEIVKEFDRAARPGQTDPSAPVTVAELNNLVTVISDTLDKIIFKLSQ